MQKLIEKVDDLLRESGKRYGPEVAPQVLIFAAASQTLHLSPDKAAILFEDARKQMSNSGTTNEPIG